MKTLRLNLVPLHLVLLAFFLSIQLAVEFRNYMKVESKKEFQENPWKIRNFLQMGYKAFAAPCSKIFKLCRSHRKA